MGDQGTRRALAAEEEGEDVAPAGPRPFWSGTITFGLVSIPVNLFPAVRFAGVRTRLLAPDGTPLERRYFCPKQEEDVTRDELVRGYELDDGEHVVITDEELEAIAPRKSRDIDLRRFVDADELDPFLFERAYVLTPGGESHKAYRLLADVMEREGKAGIATFVMREREYLIAILAEKGILRGETLRFADEVRSPADVGLPDRGKVTPALVAAFENVIRKAEKSDISRDELGDERTEKLKKLIERKRREETDIIEAPAAAAEEEEDESKGEGGAEIDLLEAIRRSLSGGKGAGEGGRAKPQRAGSKPSPRKAAASTRARKTTAARGRAKKTATKTKRR